MYMYIYTYTCIHTCIDRCNVVRQAKHLRSLVRSLVCKTCTDTLPHELTEFAWHSHKGYAHTARHSARTHSQCGLG